MECSKRRALHLPVVFKCKQVSALSFISFADTWHRLCIPFIYRKTERTCCRNSICLRQGADVLLYHPYLCDPFNSHDHLRNITGTGLEDMDIDKTDMVYYNPERLWIFVAGFLPGMDSYGDCLISFMQTV